MQWQCRKCDTTIIGYKPEHCTVCHETFTSTTSGDMHRVGDHGVKEGTNRRRCPPRACSVTNSATGPAAVPHTG